MLKLKPINNYVINNLDALIVSGGGNATTTFIEFFKHRLKTNDSSDRDGLKHLGVPPLCLEDSTKYLYLHGDPIAAVASLFRRGYENSQSVKLNRYQKSSFKRVPNKMTIEEYANNGQDLIGLEQHFNNWYSDHYTTNPILFVKVDTIWDHLDEVFDFLGLNQNEIKRFPKKKDRSSVQNLSSQTIEDLEIIYKNFRDTLSQIPDIKLRERDLFLKHTDL